MSSLAQAPSPQGLCLGSVRRLDGRVVCTYLLCVSLGLQAGLEPPQQGGAIPRQPFE
jgi:hypothetical protein